MDDDEDEVVGCIVWIDGMFLAHASWRGEGKHSGPQGTIARKGEKRGMGVQRRGAGLPICTARRGKQKMGDHHHSAPVVVHCHAALRSVG